MTATSSKTTDLPGALKEQLGLISFPVLFAGLVSTDTYYSGFGVRYQLLDFPAQHLLYRGVTALMESWPLGLAYVAAMAWLAAGGEWLANRGPRLARLAQISSYAVLILVVAIAYPCALASGRGAALRDLIAATSRLPTIQSMTDAKGVALPHGGERLLLADKDTVICFKPVALSTDVPFVNILKHEDIGAIVITR